jgi:ketosteroid isomerase-like protein
MRLVASILLFLALPFACFGAKEQSLQELKAQFESARPDDRPQLGVRIAQMQLRNADRLYGDGHVEQAQVTVEDIATVCEKARDAATQTNKHLKNTEIDVRKIADKLRDIKRTVAFDDQPPLDQAIRRLEDVRTTLLKKMFANDHPKEKR